MLRECRRVLRPGGLVAGLVIHAAEDLTEAEELRAAELGPSAVSSAMPYAALTREADLQPTLTADVTSAFLTTVRTVLPSREEHRQALFESGGPEAYEEETETLEKLVEGIKTGVLRRSLFVAAKRR